MPETSRKIFSYTIDENQLIMFVNNAWADFAVENGMTNLKPEDVLDKDIMDFIAGQGTKQVFDLFFTKIRQENATIEVPFRCDSPDCRRFMRLHMSPGEKNRIHFMSWIVREEKRPTVGLLYMLRDQSESCLDLCSWCKRINTGEAEWQEVEKAVEVLGIFEDTPFPRLNHTVCPSCTESLMAKGSILENRK